MRIRRCLPLLMLAPLAGSAAAQQTRVLPAAERPLTARFEPVYRVGGSSAPEWAAFTRVFHVAFDGAGRLYIGDPVGNRVVVVSPQGKYERSIGRAGEGPGEFKSVAAMTVDSAGVIYVYDFALARFTAFVPGRADPITRMLEKPEQMPGLHIYAAGGGEVVSAQLGFTRIGEVETAPPGTAILRHDILSSGRVKEIWRAWLPADQHGGGPRPATEVSLGWKGFETAVSLAVLPGGHIALADTTDYRIRILSRDGNLEDVWTRAVPPVRVTRAMIDGEKQKRTDAWHNRSASGSRTSLTGSAPAPRPAITPSSEARLKKLLDNMTFPDQLQVIQRLSVDARGRLWVGRGGKDPWQNGPMDVIASDGSYLGTIPPRARGVPDAFGPGGLAAWIDKDENDAPVIIVERVTM